MPDNPAFYVVPFQTISGVFVLLSEALPEKSDSKNKISLCQRVITEIPLADPWGPEFLLSLG